jgi:hypothetical protein
MFAGFADHGTYLATTPQAMPDDAKNITLLNALSYGRIYADRIETYPFLETDITIAPITPSVWKACYEAMEETLRKDKMHHDNLDRLIRNLFAPATCPPESAVDYAIMDQWEREGGLSGVKWRLKKGNGTDYFTFADGLICIETFEAVGSGFKSMGKASYFFDEYGYLVTGHRVIKAGTKGFSYTGTEEVFFSDAERAVLNAGITGSVERTPYNSDLVL